MGPRSSLRGSTLVAEGNGSGAGKRETSRTQTFPDWLGIRVVPGCDPARIPINRIVGLGLVDLQAPAVRAK